MGSKTGALTISNCLVFLEGNNLAKIGSKLVRIGSNHGSFRFGSGHGLFRFGIGHGSFRFDNGYGLANIGSGYGLFNLGSN